MVPVPRIVLAAAALAAAMALFALGGFATVARAAGGWVVTQRDGAGTSRVMLTPGGLRYELLTPSRKGAKPKAQLGVVVRYRDRRLLLLDPATRRYQELSLVTALADYRAELRASAKAQPSERLPVKPGTKRRSGQAPLALPRARLRKLPLTARIRGVRARAYLLQAGSSRERLWFSATLPAPPPAVRALLSGTVSGVSALTRATGSQAGRIPLRIDIPKGGGWTTVLRTTSIRRTGSRTPSLHPPGAYKPKSMLQRVPKGRSKKAAYGADVPATVIRCGIIVLCGPISEHPDLWAFYWGTHFAEHRDLINGVNHALQNFVGDEFADGNSPAFWGPLGQYGVGKGRFLGSQVVNERPDGSVGSWNFFDIDWFVITHRYGSDAPNIWWRWGDHDPILAIFVDEEQVDSSGWNGYHFFTPTEASLIAGIAHANMPWFIVKVPGVSTLASDDQFHTKLHGVLDQTTRRAAHEFVEAATDPYPFTSWADPLKEPIWEQGEIGDICSQGDIKPYGMAARTVKTGTAFSTYWSNRDDACMPDSRPSLRLTYPTGPVTIGYRVEQTFLAQADDTFDGSVSAANIRWIDDVSDQIGTGLAFTTKNLQPGIHHISVTATNSLGATRTAGPVTVTVNAPLPPAVRIDSPAAGSSFGTDQKLNLRGSVFDPQEGDVGAQATWSVDGTTVGTGAALLTTQITTQGTHAITLSYRNSAGILGTATVNVTIGPASGKPSVTITDPPLLEGYVDRYVTPGVPFKLAALADTQGVATISNPSGYVWASDIDGVLGTGSTLNGATLTAGTHHVTVTVTDNLNRVGTDTITIISQPPIG